METKGLKYDKGKLRYDLLPIEIEEVVEVLTYGANKYEANSWQNVENGIDRYFAALMRHLWEFNKGHIRDEESGLRHLAHVATNALFLLHLTKDN